MQNLSDQGRPVSRMTDIGCHPSGRYFIQPKDNRELMPLDQVSMAVQMIGQEVYPIIPAFGWTGSEERLSDSSEGGGKMPLSGLWSFRVRTMATRKMSVTRTPPPVLTVGRGWFGWVISYPVKIVASVHVGCESGADGDVCRPRMMGGRVKLVWPGWQAPPNKFEGATRKRK